MLEKKLGIKNDPKKKKRVIKSLEQEGLGDGFMDFLDGIENKLKMKKDTYKPQEYVFSDGEGPEEGDLEMAKGKEDDSDQEGFEGEFSD